MDLVRIGQRQRQAVALIGHHLWMLSQDMTLPFSRQLHGAAEIGTYEKDHSPVLPATTHR